MLAQPKSIQPRQGLRVWREEEEEKTKDENLVQLDRDYLLHFPWLRFFLFEKLFFGRTDRISISCSTEKKKRERDTDCRKSGRFFSTSAWSKTRRSRRCPTPPPPPPPPRTRLGRIFNVRLKGSSKNDVMSRTIWQKKQANTLLWVRSSVFEFHSIT